MLFFTTNIKAVDCTIRDLLEELSTKLNYEIRNMVEEHFRRVIM